MFKNAVYTLVNGYAADNIKNSKKHKTLY